MPLGTIDIDIDPVLHVGGLGIHWYGILYAVAFAVALYLGSVPHLERRGVDRGTVERYATWAIVGGLVGARLYYVVQSSPPQGGSWFSHPEEIPAVWHGGMAFFGAVIAAPLVLAFLAWRDGHNWWLWADAAGIFGVLGQPIGRIGNVVNGDILGYSSTLPWATSYSHPDAVLQSGFVDCAASRLPIGTDCVAYQPAAVYEALGTLVILGILVTLRMRRNPRAGTLFIVYVALYCVSQFLIFFLRGSESTVALGLKQAQWTALVVGLVGVPLLAYAWRRDWLDWAPVGTETGALVDAGGPSVDAEDDEEEGNDDEDTEADEDEDEEVDEEEDEPAPPPTPVRAAPRPARIAPAPPAAAADLPDASPRRRTPGSVTRVRRAEPEPEPEAPAAEAEPEIAEPEADVEIVAEELEPEEVEAEELEAEEPEDVEPDEVEPEELEAVVEAEVVTLPDAAPDEDAEVDDEAGSETEAADLEPDAPAAPAAAAAGPRPQRPPVVDPNRAAGRGRRRGRGRGRGR